MSKDELLMKLMQLDFLAVDLQLFLDTHPSDGSALAKYNETVIMANKLRKDYERNYGPLYSFRSEQSTEYKWIDCPWPWQYEMNFEMEKGEKNYVDL
jgi:spore coat protein JB